MIIFIQIIRTARNRKGLIQFINHGIWQKKPSARCYPLYWKSESAILRTRTASFLTLAKLIDVNCLRYQSHYIALINEHYRFLYAFYLLLFLFHRFNCNAIIVMHILTNKVKPLTATQLNEFKSNNDSNRPTKKIWTGNKRRNRKNKNFPTKSSNTVPVKLILINYNHLLSTHRHRSTNTKSPFPKILFELRLFFMFQVSIS